MGGYQIPASGAKTIADFVAKIGGTAVAISLKLYTEGQLKVGGSFFDLSNDMLDPNQEWASWASAPEFEGGAMRYLVCTKDFGESKGKDPLARTGNIKFFQFDITRANYFRLLGESSNNSRRCIATSKPFMAQLSEWDKSQAGKIPDLASTLPARREVGTSNEVVELFRQHSGKSMHAQISNLASKQTGAVVDRVMKLYTQTIDSSDKTNSIGSVTQVKATIGGVLFGDEFSSRGNAWTEQKKLVMPIFDIIQAHFKDFNINVLKKQDKRGEAVDEIEWSFGGDELYNWYEGLSPVAKAVAIQNTRGYLTKDEWIVPNKRAMDLGGGTPFATLPIGAPYVQGLLDSVRNEVMDQVFTIFDEMALMSEKLNTFFATGLEDTGEAESGAQAGEKAAEKTRKVADI